MRYKLAYFFLALVFLAGCARPVTSTPASSPTPSPVAGPTETPTPQSPLVILVLPIDMPKDESDLYQSTVYDLAQQNSMRFQVRNSLTLADVQAEGSALKVVIVLPPDPGLVELSAATPQVQFLAINIPGLATATNLSTIGAAGPPVEQQAFLAGYMAAMLAIDYRIGMIGIRDDPKSDLAENAFKNGMVFYCGLCQKFSGPWETYPIFNNIPLDTPQGQYPAYAAWLNQHSVAVAYVFQAVATPELLAELASRKILIIGEKTPVKDLQVGWIASIQPILIPAIQRIFPDLLTAHGGQTLSFPLELTDINPDLLSEGKLRLAQKVLDDLQAGFISTEVTP